MKPNNYNLNPADLCTGTPNGNTVNFRIKRSRVGPNSIPVSWPVESRVGWGPERSFLAQSSVNYDQEEPYIASLNRSPVSGDQVFMTQITQNRNVDNLTEMESSSHENFGESKKQERISDEEVYSSIVSLGIVGFPASILAILALQLLLHLEYYNRSSALKEEATYGILFDVALSLCAVSLTFSITAMFVAFLHLFLCLKAIKLAPASKIRTMKFLRQGMFLRFVSFIGFFLSIPLFLLGNFELAVDPPVEVVPFSGALGGGVQQQLTLTNNAGYQLAFKVKCTDNNVIKIDNAAGLLPVGQSANVVFSSGPLPGPPPPQNIYIMNVPAEGAPDAQSAFAAAPEGSGKVELDAAFD